MKHSEIIKKAVEIISVPEKWTQNTNARDTDGNRVFADSKSAVCWCALGAIEKVSNELEMLRISYKAEFEFGFAPSMVNDCYPNGRETVIEKLTHMANVLDSRGE